MGIGVQSKHAIFPKIRRAGIGRCGVGLDPGPATITDRTMTGFMCLRAGRGLKRYWRGVQGRQRGMSSEEKRCWQYRTRPPRWRRCPGQADRHCRARNSRLRNRDGGLWGAEPEVQVRLRTSRSSRQGKAHARRAGAPGHCCRLRNPAAPRTVVPAQRVAGKAQRRKEATRNDPGGSFAGVFPYY